MEQIGRLDRLVDSILASVRVDREQPPDLEPTDVGAIIHEVVDELAPLLGHHRVDVHGGIRLYALTGPVRVRQILAHRLEDAVKYAPPDTAIRLGWKLVEGGVRVSVADEGPGIPEEWRERIFEPYARRETHTARGSGIGLYAARRLAESVGARLRARRWLVPCASSSWTTTRRWSGRSPRSSARRATRSSPRTTG